MDGNLKSEFDHRIKQNERFTGNQKLEFFLNN